MITLHKSLSFDRKQGCATWRKAVAEWGAARRRFAQQLVLPQGAHRTPRPVSGMVVALEDWRWNQACLLTPLEEAEANYKEASVRLISEPSPDMYAHYLKVRLVAELLGAPDPKNDRPDRHPWRQPLSAGLLLHELGRDCFGLREAWLADDPDAAGSAQLVGAV